ncbi:MAG: BirA family transcriptional regulator [Solirubrobacterales bacterium]|jgi:BirA family biotin operon repressor/biotin-[acetyl-CoA-carboxylase] ligase|nr:BirA family transcriptional regulator [Solirubrobacterales bacterium]
MTFGSPHRHYRVTDSTNSRARELVEAGTPGGTVVTAREQTEGRGRQGRVWTAPEGKALLYSAVLRSLDERHLLLPLSVPLAVCAAAEALRPDAECMVKWPNDVWIEGRKLAGILIEAKPQDGWAVIGVGLNLSIAPEEFPGDLRQPAISLFDATAGSRGGSRRSLPAVAPAGLPPTPSTAAAVLNRHLDHWVWAGHDDVLAEWRRRDGLLGREVSWEDGSGVADGIDDRGNLIVAVAGGGRVSLGAGEVQLRL